MPIIAKDIVIYESARLTDEDSGGGLPTGKQVIDGQVNNLFPDTSRLDRTQGRVNIRKLFCGVAVDTQEAYTGSHFMVSKDAADQHVNMIAFAGSATDTRLQVKNEIESYLVPGYSARMYLLGDQFKGQRMILAFQELSATEPELGGTLLLRGIDKESQAAYEQYVKIAEYEGHEQTFTYEHNGEFKTLVRRVCTIKLSARLDFTFYGGTPYPTGVMMMGGAKAADILTTTVADAARYYSVSALARSAVPGDIQVRVASVYKPIVPSAYSESLLTDRYAAVELALMQPAGPAITRSQPFALVTGSQSRSYLERVPQRGSLSLSLDGGIFKDNGSGELKFQSGNNNFSKLTVNFETGQIDVWRNAGVYTGTASATYTPAVRLLGSVMSEAREVTAANRTFNWTFDFSAAPPLPGSVRVHYRALSKWQLLEDLGTGQLSGQGAGTVNFVTGALAITCAVLPDVESEIIVQYQPAQSLAIELLGGARTVQKNQRLELPDAVLPGSLSIGWVSGATQYSLQSDAVGNLTGHGSGTVRAVDGLIEFVPQVMPSNGLYQLSYTEDNRLLGELVIPTAAGTGASGTVGQAFKPGSLLLGYPVRHFNHAGRYHAEGDGTWATLNVVIRDDGAGNLKRDGVVVGTVTTAFAERMTFRTPGSPLKQANFQLVAVAYDGTLINASADAQGELIGSGVSGSVNTNTGVCKVQFGKAVMASSVRYHTVLLTALPLDAARIGLDPVRLPADGKVPIYQDSDVVVLSHTAQQEVGAPAAGAVLDAGRDYVADLYLQGANGKRLTPSQYSENRDSGLLTLNTPYNLVDEAGAAVTTPLTLVNRIEHMSLVQDVQISGELTLAIPLVHDYPAGETMVSSCLQFGDRFASWGSNFVQQSWNAASPNWSATPVGGAISANYNWADHPLQVTDRGAVDEKWALVFTSTTTYNLLSQTRGLIGSGNLSTDLAPLNPNTGTPYFVLEAAGLSSGWATGNVVRFDTKSALAPVWLLRCVSVGRATHPDDRFEVTQRGDAD